MKRFLALKLPYLVCLVSVDSGHESQQPQRSAGAALGLHKRAHCPPQLRLRSTTTDNMSILIQDFCDS
eukprot:COSAG04_NODE_21683_length_369_cov_0.988889_2_plen_67_part_01